MNERETAALQVEDLTYNADGLIPCIVQDEQTREVLMMAWMKRRRRKVFRWQPKSESV